MKNKFTSDSNNQNHFLKLTETGNFLFENIKMKWCSIVLFTFFYSIVHTTCGQGISFEEQTHLGILLNDEISAGSTSYADVDNDGDLDVLIVGGYFDDSLAKLFLNDGEGGFIELEPSPFKDVYNATAVFGDVDADNDQDVLIMGYSPNIGLGACTKLYVNDGYGGFSESDNSFLGLLDGDVKFADLDGDLDLDVFIMGRDGDYIKHSKIYENDGNGQFSLWKVLPGFSSGEIAIADVDGDNDLDVFIFGAFDDDDGEESKLFINSGLAVFIEDTNAPFYDEAVSSTAFVDIDGDNDQDLVTVETTYINDGNGNFEEIEGTPFLYSNASFIDFKDVDGDNDLDIFVMASIGSGSYALKLFINNGEGVFVESDMVFSGDVLGANAFFDVDNDGDIDVLQIAKEDTKLYFNNGSASFSTVSDPRFPTGSKTFAFFDADGDDDQDLIFSAGGWHLYLNDGQGLFSKVDDSPFLDAGYTAVDVSDVDNDGDLDVMLGGGPVGISSPTTGVTKLFLNDGNASFTESLDTSFKNIGGELGDVVFADIDGDEDEDVIVIGGGQSGKYINDGGGSFSLEENLTVHNSLSAIDLADVDGDGDLDLLITGQAFSRKTTLYLNDSNGGFTEEIWNSFINLANGDVAFEDVDNDGDMDLLIVGETNGGVTLAQLYLNDGDGFFTAQETPIDGVTRGKIAFCDVDNDNDADLFVTGTSENDVVTKLYTNDGNGVFMEYFGLPFPPLSNSAVAFADIDNDDDQDMMLMGNKPFVKISRLYTNVSYKGRKFYVSNPPAGTQNGSSPENAAQHLTEIIDQIESKDFIQILDGEITEGSNLVIPEHTNIHLLDDVLWDMGEYDLDNSGLVSLKNTASFIQGTDSELSGDGHFELIQKSIIDSEEMNLISLPIQQADVETVFADTDVMAFDPSEQDGGAMGWEEITNGFLSPLKAYAVYGSNAPFFNGKRYFTGIPNNGTMSIPLDGQNYGGIYDGWNLIGNPYPSPIDVNTFLFENNDIGAITLYDQSEGMYVCYNRLTIDDGMSLAMGQGFFVEYSLDDEGSASFTNAMRSSNWTALEKMSNHAISEIKIFNYTNHYNTTIVFDEAASDDFEIDNDAKLIPGANELTIFSLLNDEAFAIQAQSTFVGEKTVPIGFEAIDGIYKISFTEKGDFPEYYSVSLIDYELDVTHDLKENDYTFNHLESGLEKDRFSIVYNFAGLDLNDASIPETHISFANGKIEFHSDITIQGVELYDITGRKVIERIISNNKNVSLATESLSNGIYFVHITAENKRIVKKIRVLNH